MWITEVKPMVSKLSTSRKILMWPPEPMPNGGITQLMVLAGRSAASAPNGPSSTNETSALKSRGCREAATALARPPSPNWAKTRRAVRSFLKRVIALRRG